MTDTAPREVAEIPIGLVLDDEPTRRLFAQRLHDLMTARGLNQAALSRRADIGRDSISKYLRATYLPNKASLRKLCDALGVKPNELVPNALPGVHTEAAPAEFEIRSVNGNTWLRIDQEVTMEQALRIMEILNPPATTEE